MADLQEPALLPCPFCGEAPTYYLEANWIVCTNWDGCAVHPGLDKVFRDKSRASAITAWNGRAALPQVDPA